MYLKDGHYRFRLGLPFHQQHDYTGVYHGRILANETTCKWLYIDMGSNGGCVYQHGKCLTVPLIALMMSIQSSVNEQLVNWAKITYPLNFSRPTDIYPSVNLVILGADNGLLPTGLLNKGWLIFNWIQRNKQWNFNENKVFIQENAFQNVCKMLAILSWHQHVNWTVETNIMWIITYKVSEHK